MAYIQANGGAKGLPVEEIFLLWYSAGTHLVIQNKNECNTYDGLSGTDIANKSVCVKSVATVGGNYFQNITVKKSGYYSFCKTGYQNFVNNMTPFYLSANSNITSSGDGSSEIMIIYYGETNPFA